MATRITDEQRYIILRGQLQTELNSISDQLSALEQRRDELQDLLYAGPEIAVEKVPGKVRLTKKMVTQKGTNHTVNLTLMDEVVGFIYNNPGSSRADIRYKFSTVANASLSRALENASKRKLIKNKGTRASSKWYIA